MSTCTSTSITTLIISVHGHLLCIVPYLSSSQLEATCQADPRSTQRPNGWHYAKGSKCRSPIYDNLIAVITQYTVYAICYKRSRDGKFIYLVCQAVVTCIILHKWAQHNQYWIVRSNCQFPSLWSRTCILSVSFQSVYFWSTCPTCAQKTRSCPKPHG